MSGIVASDVAHAVTARGGTLNEFFAIPAAAAAGKWAGATASNT